MYFRLPDLRRNSPPIRRGPPVRRAGLIAAKTTPDLPRPIVGVPNRRAERPGADRDLTTAVTDLFIGVAGGSGSDGDGGGDSKRTRGFDRRRPSLAPLPGISLDRCSIFCHAKERRVRSHLHPMDYRMKRW